MSQTFEAALRRKAVPYRVFGGRAFYTRREVRDILAYLRLLATPSDDAAFMRVVNVPPRGMGAASLQKLRDKQLAFAEGGRGEPLTAVAKAALLSDKPPRGLGDFLALLTELSTLAASCSLHALVEATIARTAYREMLQSEAADEYELAARRDVLTRLLEDADAFTPDDPDIAGLDRLRLWLDRVSLSGADDADEPQDRVVLTTVHSAKGLEYPVVFVVQMAEGCFPHARSLESHDGASIDEERRLAYVAFTRAERHLYVTRHVERAARPEPGPGRSRHKSKPETLAPSRFLFGLPTDAVRGDLPDDGSEQRTLSPHEQRKAARRDTERQLGRLQRAKLEPAWTPGASTAIHEVMNGTQPLASASHTAAQLTEGRRVWHENYGEGVIRSVKNDMLLIEVIGPTGGIIRVSTRDPALRLLGD